MSDDLPASAKSSPSKGSWVQFDEDGQGEGNSKGSPSKKAASSPASSSSGVSSARGSVNSIKQQEQQQQHSGASLDVSEIQVRNKMESGVFVAITNGVQSWGTFFADTSYFIFHGMS